MACVIIPIRLSLSFLVAVCFQSLTHMSRSFIDMNILNHITDHFLWLKQFINICICDSVYRFPGLTEFPILKVNGKCSYHVYWIISIHVSSICLYSPCCLFTVEIQSNSKVFVSHRLYGRNCEKVTYFKSNFHFLCHQLLAKLHFFLLAFSCFELLNHFATVDKHFPLEKITSHTAHTHICLE